MTGTIRSVARFHQARLSSRWRDKRRRNRSSAAFTVQPISTSMANVRMMAATISKPRIWFLCSAWRLASAAARRDRAVREPAADAVRRIHLQHRRTRGRSRPAISMSSIFSGLARSAKWPRAAPRRNCSRRCPRAASAMRSGSTRSGRMFIADYKKHNMFVVEPGSTSRGRTFIPTSSISRTI